MATTSQRVRYSEDGNLDTPSRPSSPGHSVTNLIEAGNMGAAQAEFERLCLEGLDSGDMIPMNAEKWEEFRLDLHRRAKIAS